jgi:hypothetical protein
MGLDVTHGRQNRTEMYEETDFYYFHIMRHEEA